MKKVLSIIVTAILVLAIGTGCREKGTKARVIVPDGAPSMAIAQMMKNEKGYNYQIVSSTDIASAFSKGDAEYIIAPTNMGMQLSMSSSNYKIAAVTSWGNLYIVTNNDNLNPLSACTDYNEFLAQLSGKTVASIGVNQVPSVSFRHLVQGKNIQVTEYSSAQIVQSNLGNGSSELAILGEPAVTATTINVAGTKILCSISELWHLIVGTEFPQASLFVKSNLSSEKVYEFLSKLENSINYLNASEDNAYELGKFMEDSGLSSLKGAIVKKSYLRMSQKFVLAKDKKQDIINFIGVLGVNYNPGVNVFYGENI